MARNNDRDRGKKPIKDDRRRPAKKRPSPLSANDDQWIDYKDVNLLRKFMSDRGKIRGRRVTGSTQQQQRAVALAIKTARELALLPYHTRTVTERRPMRSAPEAAAEVPEDVFEGDDVDNGEEG